MSDLDYIINTTKEHGITAYEISKATNLNESGVLRLLKGNVSKPHSSTIRKIKEYLLDKYNTNTIRKTHQLLKDDVKLEKTDHSEIISLLDEIEGSLSVNMEQISRLKSLVMKMMNQESKLQSKIDGYLDIFRQEYNIDI